MRYAELNHLATFPRRVLPDGLGHDRRAVR